MHEAGANHRMEIVAALRKTQERVPQALRLVETADALMAEVPLLISVRWSPGAVTLDGGLG